MKGQNGPFTPIDPNRPRFGLEIKPGRVAGLAIPWVKIGRNQRLAGVGSAQYLTARARNSDYLDQPGGQTFPSKERVVSPFEQTDNGDLGGVGFLLGFAVAVEGLTGTGTAF